MPSSSLRPPRGRGSASRKGCGKTSQRSGGLKLLKSLRQIQEQQIKIADLQRQFDQATTLIKQLQGQMEADCAAAAKEAKVDLTKYTCDLDQLAFVAKAAEVAKTPEKKEMMSDNYFCRSCCLIEGCYQKSAPESHQAVLGMLV